MIEPHGRCAVARIVAIDLLEDLDALNVLIEEVSPERARAAAPVGAF
jgi:hypothetical protein